jgi:hypothetical protein
MSKKSQMATTDLFIALFAATILIIIIIFAWNNYALILNEDVNYKEMQIKAFQTADLLIKSKGVPVNWEENPTNIDVIGLAASDRNLSTEKVSAFLNASYNITLKSLGIELYNFYFRLKDLNGTEIAEYRNASASNKSIINIQRLVLYENKIDFFVFGLF